MKIGRLTILVVLVVLACSAWAADDPKGPPEVNVNVVNTEANPVPVVGVVSLPGTQDVNVVNTVSIKNVDEPGREPYEFCIEFKTDEGCRDNCENYYTVSDAILFDGPVVPEGKRLIIRHVSGRLPTERFDEVSVALQKSRIIEFGSIQWAFFGPFFPALASVGFSGEAFATYGPGERPHLNLRVPESNTQFSFISLSGYLIDAE